MEFQGDSATFAALKQGPKPRAKSQEPRAKSQEPKTKDKYHKT